MASDFFRPRLVPTVARAKDDLPAAPGGCLFSSGNEAMNESKAESPKRGLGRAGLIYMVDDETMLLELASVVLEPVGYTVETFSTPESALGAFAAAEPKPVLIITDYTMHNMTGLELAAQCRRIQPEQKILLVTGTVGQEIFQSAPVQPDGFLAKPYQANQLIAMVRSVLADEPG